ncbi:hypothetical protein [Actinoplanes sp. DH11]|uniref:hypothetical protein n=1 Tax=Actinoplanes sp. DH11 TaxID=2857011 RepID=UPI001E5D2D77|nr:hypothetical protein [Actinoplanes sp. DH11]
MKPIDSDERFPDADDHRDPRWITNAVRVVEVPSFLWHMEEFAFGKPLESSWQILRNRF